MLYDLETPSGTTLRTLTTQLDALREARILSMGGRVILVTCVHLGSHSHRVCVVCNGWMVNPMLTN